jgi:tetrahydromethanopterin S-methyltransferase subunit G
MKAYREDLPVKDDTRLALLEQSIGHINETMMRFEKRFDRLDERFDKIDQKLQSINDKVDQKFQYVHDKIDTNFKWVIGSMISLFILNGFAPIIIKTIAGLLSAS